MNKILYIITLIISVTALLVGVFSYRASINSNEIARKSTRVAEEALSTARSNFETENRPYLNIRSVRFKESGEYIEVVQSGDTLTFTFKFKLENAGQLPASDIRTPDMLLLAGREDQIKGLKWVMFSKPSKTVALVPGESIFISLSMSMKGLSDDAIKENLQRYEQGELEFPVELSVLYKSSVDSDADYKTSVILTVGVSKVSIHETIIK